MRTVLIGTILYGFCNGHFGRDSYNDKRIEGIGVDWIVARNIDSQIITFANFESESQMLKYIKRWKVDTKLLD